MLRKYETITILSSELGEAQLKDEIKRIEGLLQAQGAIHIHVDRWAKRELGFRMKKQNLGNYVFFTYETPNPATIEALTANLRIADAVLKFQTHKISSRVRKFKGMIRKSGSGDGFGGDDFSDVADAEFLPG